MEDMQINTIEIIEELKRQIGELSQGTAILTIKCRKLEEQINSCKCTSTTEEEVE